MFGVVKGRTQRKAGGPDPTRQIETRERTTYGYGAFCLDRKISSNLLQFTNSMANLRNLAYRLLRRSETYTETDMVYVARGGFWTTLRFAIGMLTSVATIIAFGNLLPRENYGIYNYLLSLGASLSFLTLSGIGPAVVRSIARGFESVARYALRLQIKFNLIAVLVVLAAA